MPIKARRCGMGQMGARAGKYRARQDDCGKARQRQTTQATPSPNDIISSGSDHSKAVAPCQGLVLTGTPTWCVLTPAGGRKILRTLHTVEHAAASRAPALPGATDARRGHRQEPPHL